MKIENSIGWCDETTNAVTGCDKVSPGCKNCYAAVGTRARVLRGQGIETWGPNGVRHPVAQFAQKIRRLNKLCVCDDCHLTFPVEALTGDHICIAKGECHSCDGRLRRIRLFADSNSDWLDEKWPFETLASFLDEIRRAQNVDVILLTKRIEKWGSRIEAVLKWIESSDCKWLDKTSNLPLRNWLADWFTLKKPPLHIIGMVSVEDQKRADERIALLLEAPFARRGLSVEPLLEEIDLTKSPGPGGANHLANAFDGNALYAGDIGGPEYAWSPRGMIDWIIVGGESGNDRRDCGVNAIVSVAAQAITAGVPVYVKQDCAFKSGQQGRIPDEIWKRKEFPRR